MDVGLVLGAGASTRFGSSKQLAILDGQPLINWAVATLRAGGLGQVLVVLGAHHEVIAPVLKEASAIVTALDWQEGLSASLRAGVAAAAERDAARVVIALADQPLLSAAAVARTLAASRTGAPIVRASYDGIPAHPTALARETFPAVSRLRGDSGARRLTGFDVLEVPCDGLGSPADVDTPADLDALARYISG